MIEITYTPLAMRFEGHAGYAAKGKDIVCAGVSALYGALIESLNDAEERGEGKLFWNDKTGEVRFEALEVASERIRTIFETIWCGLRLMQSHYENHVTLRRTFSPN